VKLLITKRGGFLVLFAVSLELFALSFYAIRDFAGFIRDLLGFDLKKFVPNIYELINLSPALIITSMLILTSVIVTFTNFQYISGIDFLEIQREVSADRCFAGDFVTVTLRIRNKSRLWISNIFISDIIPDVFDLVFGENYITTSLPPRSTIELSYIVRCGVRGHYKIGPVQVTVQDKAGLFVKSMLIENYTELLVYPPYEDVKRLEMLQKVYGTLLFGRFKVREKGQGYDFWGLRKYLPGDSIKFIDWKTSAKAGTLYVKEYEAEKNIKLYVFIDASSSMGAGTKRRTKLDYATRAAVLLSYLASRSQDLFGLVVYSEGMKDFVPARKGRMHFYKILEKLAKAEPEGSSNLSRAMKEFILREKRSSLAIVVSDLEGDPTILEEAVRTALAHNIFVIVIAPIGPLFEEKGKEELSSAFYEVALTEYMKRREQVKYRLAKYGIYVLDVGPEDLLAMSLEAFLRAKSRSIAII